MHFGFIDGIYLVYGGQDLEKFDKAKFRLYSRFLFMFQLLITLFLLVFCLIFFNGYRLLIFVFVILNLIPLNFTTFFQFISQITFRFKEYSKRLNLISFLNLLSVFLVYFFDLTNYFFIIFFTTLANYYLFFMYVITYQNLVFGKSIKLLNSFAHLKELFLKGLPLLLSNFIMVLLLTIDKIFVEIYFDITLFSVYSFAYSILAIINVIISAISTIVYPYFKKFEIETLSKSYFNLNLYYLLWFIHLFSG
jgi:O-antigen/teichoic acid export membrane protein